MVSGKLEDGSEKGLKGHFAEDFSHRERVGLAPRAGHVDRIAPYQRIATEEAWTFPALVKAQVEWLESGHAPDDDSLKMAGLFAKMPSLQEMLLSAVEVGAPGRPVARTGESAELLRQLVKSAVERLQATGML